MESLNRELWFARALRSQLEEKSLPEQWDIDWEDEPYRYTFRAVEDALDLDPYIPLTFGRSGSLSEQVGNRFEHYLYYIAAPLHVRRMIEPNQGAASKPAVNLVTIEAGEIEMYRPSDLMLFRSCPSAGALYPWEVYVTGGRLDAGQRDLFHYDAGHHRLVRLVRNTPPDEMLQFSSGRGEADALIFITWRYWKSYFKYANACIRLHGFDSGVLLSQIELLAPYFDLDVEVQTLFEDEGSNRFVGLDSAQESVVALVRVSARQGTPSITLPATDTAEDSPNKLGGSIERSRRPMSCTLAAEYFRFTQLSVQEATELRCQNKVRQELPDEELFDGCDDVAVLFRQRTSGVHRNIAQNVPADTIAQLAAISHVIGPWDTAETAIDATQLYVAAQRVDGLNTGIYRWHESSLTPVREMPVSDLSRELQASYNLNIGFAATSATFFIVAQHEDFFDRIGNRGLRVLDLWAGRLSHRIHLACSVRGLGSHIFYGFSASRVERLCGLESQSSSVALSVVVGRKPIDHPCLNLPIHL